MVHGKNIVLKFIKPVFILILLTIYFYLVARPSIDKYFEGGVLTKDETPNSSYYPPSPAVTFCAFKNNTGFDMSLEKLDLHECQAQL